jgi:hypothetical protein
MTQLSELLAAEAARRGLSERRLSIEADAGHLRHADELGADIEAEEASDPWIHSMLEAFRKVPGEWKPIGFDHSRTFVRLSPHHRHFTEPGWSAPNRHDAEEDDQPMTSQRPRSRQNHGSGLWVVSYR